MFVMTYNVLKLQLRKTDLQLLTHAQQLLKGLNLPCKLNNYPFCLILKLQPRKLIPKL